MTTPLESNPPSKVEYLDNEPQRRLGGVRPELLFGILLLLGLCLFGAVDWWRSQDRLDNYRAGERAAAAHNWEEAAHRYSAADGYADAAQRATDAARNIVERDQYYSTAVTAAEAANWPSALDTLREVERIQPGYRDTASRITAARAGVYVAALPGAILMRTDANPPGLYYYVGNQWQWLAGSDSKSTVHGDGSAGSIVYDVPATSGSGTDRTMMIAGVRADHIAFTPARIDPTRYADFIWGASGGWGFAEAASGECGEVDLGASGGCISATHVDASGTTIATFNVPGDAWGISDTAPDGSKVLISSGSGGELYPSLSLYVLDAARPTPTLLYSRAGRLYQADFSPDGKSVLITIALPGDGLNEYMSVTVVDVDDAKPPRVLLETGRDYGGPYIRLSATFLSGTHVGEVMLAERDNRQTRLVRYDVASGAEQGRVWAGDGLSTPFWIMPTDEGGMVIGWYNTLGYTGRSFLLSRPGAEAKEIIPPLDRNEALYSAWLEENNLVYLSGRRHDGMVSYALRTMQLADRDQSQAPNTLIYAATMSDQADLTTMLSTGPTMFAYLNGQELRARTYDGAIDVLLDEGVAAIYNSRLRKDQSSLP